MAYTPMAIAPARAWRSYRGGKLLGRIHGREEEDGHYPEEWLMSVVEARNPAGVSAPGEGLSMLRDGLRSLREAIAADAAHMLGEGKDSPGVLMKILDAAERLCLQVHPTRADARRYFSSPYGKTECWYILGGREIGGQKPCIYFGFQPGVTRDMWEELFYRQDVPGMLRCLHKIEVRSGEVYFIEGGVPHAIGAGCLLAEIQEPTDLTLRAELFSASGARVADENCHLGIGYERMLDCFRYDGAPLEETLRRWRVPPVRAHADADCEIMSLLDGRHTAFFRLEQMQVRGEARIQGNGQFHGLYVLSGAGRCACADWEEAIGPGSQYFVPAACEGYALRACGAPMTVLRWYGPQ